MPKPCLPGCTVCCRKSLWFLDEAGYRSAAEVKLKISDDFEPVPDVIAASGLPELPYPTKPVDVVVEILSPEDSFQRVVRKCKLYAAWGVPAVVVVDPDAREAWTWENESKVLETVEGLRLPNGKSIVCRRLFEALAQATRPQ